MGHPVVPRDDDPFVAGLLARTMLPERTSVHVACSGGADSTALLALAVAAGRSVTAVHVDHGSRPGSDREAEAVAVLAARWGADFSAERVEVPPGPNMEERWRDARRAVLPQGCLLGHTADDQAETVLVRLLRGTGPDGLAAMDPATHPILALRRSDTTALCAHLGVQPLDDPTNADPRFVRNRVRTEVLPLLCDVAGRDVVPLLARLADLAAAQRAYVAAEAAGIDATDTAALRAVDPVVAAAALRSWWEDLTAGSPPPNRAAVDRMLDVVAGRSRATEVADGWRLERRDGRLRLLPPGPTA